MQKSCQGERSELFPRDVCRVFGNFVEKSGTRKCNFEIDGIFRRFSRWNPGSCQQRNISERKIQTRWARSRKIVPRPRERKELRTLRTQGKGRQWARDFSVVPRVATRSRHECFFVICSAVRLPSRFMLIQSDSSSAQVSAGLLWQSRRKLLRKVGTRHCEILDSLTANRSPSTLNVAADSWTRNFPFVLDLITELWNF